MEEQLVVFELAGEAYGVDVGYVQSIMPMQQIVTVPGAHSFVEGVVNLRGAVAPVVDLRNRFQLKVSDEDQKSVIVIIELDDMQVGLIVDKVTEVTKIAESSIEPPSPLLTGIDSAFLRGIGKLNEDKVVILLDLGRIFALDEQQLMAQVAAAEEPAVAV